MIKVLWEMEEAIALFDLYFRYGGSLSVPKTELNKLTEMYHKRAEKLGLVIDEKFRNESGLKMQLGCIHYVVTNGLEGMSSASRLFYETYALYQNDRPYFDSVLKEFYEKYGEL